jgi:tetratricopeptide (TPR) repeat protein
MKWPNFLECKERLFSPKTSREELTRWGDIYLEADRLHDAVAFYRQAKYPDGLNRIRERAIEDGDVLLLREALNGLDSSDAEDQAWTRLAQQAESRGRWQDALKAYEYLQDERGMRRVRREIERMMGTSSPEETSDPAAEDT